MRWCCWALMCVKKRPYSSIYLITFQVTRHDLCLASVQNKHTQRLKCKWPHLVTGVAACRLSISHHRPPSSHARSRSDYPLYFSFRRTCLHMYVRVMWASTAARALLAFERTSVSRKFIQQSASKPPRATCSAPCVWKAKVHGLHGLFFYTFAAKKRNKTVSIFFFNLLTRSFLPLLNILKAIHIFLGA